ncbi:MAG: 50S ribosomal protein L9 [Betaproteobacteria bacterium AqS2]|uniref:Large ribosomal subunit protein bL9 n=1 Tax=Candidatus Amphirhobacter heronislandensis TaxID=1732024 RepID=A0A930XW09_9GAMM|nr:50S ribosomal protein L9 [Betaproteobacteria bacterium AqS2]
MSSIQVILLRDHPTLGRMGDVVKCKRGYVRNHLLPNRLIEIYSEEAAAEFEKRKSKLLAEQRAAEEALQALHAKLDGSKLKTSVQAKEDGSLYGSVARSTVVDLLRAKKFTVKRNQIRMPDGDAIKNVGVHKIGVELAPGLVATIDFAVTAGKS